MINPASLIIDFANTIDTGGRHFLNKVKKVCSMPVKSAFTPCIKHVASIHKVCFSHMSVVLTVYCDLCIWDYVRALYYSKNKRWGEVPRFTGKSPPVRFFCFERHDVFVCKFIN